MTARTGTLTYPPEGFGAPKDRHGHATGSVGLPAGTEVFSADDHISLAEDIFYERFPESMKDQAPRVVYDDGAWTLAIGGKTLPAAASSPPCSCSTTRSPASSTNDIDARLARARVRRHPPRAGVPQRAARPHGLARQGRSASCCFRIYNEHIAELQERVGRPLLRRRDDQLVGRRRLPGARSPR